MRILFWGTPDFGLPALRALAEEGHQLVGAITQPDRPAGRGREVRESPVKRAARELDVPVLQPERPRGAAFLEEVAALGPEVSVVAAYGEILREEVLELPPRGSLNIHASLLPELRGAAPVNWAIIRGHRKSGVTVMRMVRELDAGPILHQIPVDIAPDTTAGELYAATSELGAEAIVETLALVERGALTERDQDEERATWAPKLDRDAARLDWSLPAAELDRWIRGCDPWPAAWSEVRGTSVQLFDPAPASEPAGEAGRVVVADPREGLVVAAGEGAVRIGTVKPAGKSRMAAAAWVRGRGVRAGDRFS